MTALFELINASFPAFLWVALRSAGFFFTAPLFGQQRIPVTLRALFAVLLAALVFPGLQTFGTPDSGVLWLIGGLIELLTGIIYGWSARLMFEGMILAGQLIGLQMGFAQANILNPESSTQRPLLSEIYYLLAFLVFFAINGHHLLIMVFSRSFSVIAPGQLGVTGPLMEQLVTLSGQIFIVGLMLAAPINGILTLIDLMLGLIARTAPQMNVLLLSFSIKIYVGLLSFFLALGLTVQFLKRLLPDLLEQILNLF